MRRRTTWGLLAAAVAMGAVILVLDPPGRPPGRGVAPETPPVLFPRRVERLRIESGGTAVECRRDGAVWRLAEPIEGPADTAAVNRILDGFERLPLTDVVTAAEREDRGLTWRDYGLDVPRAKLTFSGNGSALQLSVGRTGPMGGLYLRTGESPDVLVTTTNLLALIPASATALRDRTLFPGDMTRLRRFDLRRASGFVRLERDEQGRWMLRQPVSAPAAPAWVTSLREELAAARVEEFIQDGAAGEAASYGFEERAVEIGLEYADSDQPALVLQLGRTLERNPALVYARFRRGTAVYAISSSWVALANMPLDEMRDRRLVALRPDEVAAVELERDGRRMELRREGERWQITAPVKAEADAFRVRALIAEWTSARIEAFDDAASTNVVAVATTSAPPFRIVFRRPPSSPGPSAPATNAAVVATAEAPALETAVTLVFESDPTMGRPRVRRMEDNAVLVITPRKPAWCAADPLPYRSRMMLEFDPATVLRVELVKGVQTQAVERAAAGAFVPVNAPAATVPAARVQMQLEMMARLRALELVPAEGADLSAFGLEPPTASWTLAFSGASAVVKTLLLGRAGESGVYAMVRGQNVLFLLDPAVAALLKEDLLAGPPPAAPAPPPPSVPVPVSP